MKSRLTVVGPALNNVGGVSNFYGVAVKYFDKNVNYVTYETISHSLRASQFLSVFKTFYVCILLGQRSSEAVVFNPSLMPRSLWRYAILGYLYKLRGGRDLTIFWRGWNEQNLYLLKNDFLRRMLLAGNKHLVLNSRAERFLREEIALSTGEIERMSTMVCDSMFVAHRSQGAELDSESVQLVFLSRVEPYKGIFESVEVLRRMPNLQLNVYGGGSATEELNLLVRNEFGNRLKLKGFVDGKNKFDAFSNADIYFLLSASEGMPNSLLEAMACGLPVVCTDVGAMSDFFEDGKMGIMVDYPVDVDQLVERLSHLIADKAQLVRIGAYNKRYAEIHFKASRVIRRLEDLTLGFSR